MQNRRIKDSWRYQINTHSLQNRAWCCKTVLGGFDSHVPPPFSGKK